MVARARAALLSVLVGCAAEAPCGEPGAPSADPERPGNVLVVVLDDVGADQLAPWGLAEDTAVTPTIDCLCERGVRFTQAWSSPTCSPTRSELLTGRYNRRTGVGQILSSEEAPYALPTSEDTLGDLARRAGLATGYVGKWHLTSAELPDALTHPNRSGFDRFAGTLGNLKRAAELPDGDFGYSRSQEVEDGEVHLTRAYATTETVDEALSFVRRADGPWLLVVAFHAAHVPNHEPPGRLIEGSLPSSPSDLAVYQAMIEAADHELSRLLRRLDPDTLADTTVVLLGDNGTPGEVLPPALHPDRRKGTMFEGGVRVPLVVAGPGVEAPGRASDALVHVVDVLPTVGELLGVAPEASVLDGRSLVPLLADPAGPGGHDTVASFLHSPVGASSPKELLVAIRDDFHKLVRQWDGAEELYAVGPTTLFEGDDLLDGHPDEARDAVAARLRAELDALEESFRAER